MGCRKIAGWPQVCNSILCRNDYQPWDLGCPVSKQTYIGEMSTIVNICQLLDTSGCYWFMEYQCNVNQLLQRRSHSVAIKHSLFVMVKHDPSRISAVFVVLGCPLRWIDQRVHVRPVLGVDGTPQLLCQATHLRSGGFTQLPLRFCPSRMWNCGILSKFDNFPKSVVGLKLSHLCTHGFWGSESLDQSATRDLASAPLEGCHSSNG